MSSPSNNELRESEMMAPSKRPRYQRRNSFVIRRDKLGQWPTSGVSLLDNDDFHSSAPDLFSPKPEIPPSGGSDSWGNASWSNTDDTEWYRLAALSFDESKVIIPPAPKKFDNYESGMFSFSSFKRPPMPDNYAANSQVSASQSECKAKGDAVNQEGVEASPRTPRLLHRATSHTSKHT